ncbi:hypothetical protein [Sphaerisporangium fuscum]|uniref:hypothetical protein n=1 Tax=Sphaerisporangium fuscum TaxID=2835868 RepID=UPI001BDC2859|nr:hypothetical protein [Sphaerisporangium fuscum]
MRKAFEACRSLMPQGGFGRGRGADDSVMRAFRTCMKDNGAELPQDGGMRRLETGDPKIAQALKKCRPLLPTRAPGAPGDATATPATTT